MCPFCYLGDAHLAKALEQFPHRDSVEIRYHSFLLMPELPADTAIGLNELLETKRGISPDQAEAMNAQVAEQGRAAGLDYQMGRAIATNTRAAHGLSHFAAESGLQHEMILRLFKAYFTEGLNVGDHNVLADLAAEIGLDRDQALKAVSSDAYAHAVDADIDQARQLGISGVPFFIFDGQFAVSGARPVESFLEALNHAWNERTSTAAAQR